LSQIVRHNPDIDSLQYEERLLPELEFSATEARLIVDTLQNTKSLISLDLERASLGDQGVAYLARSFLQDHKTLKVLNLGANDIRETGLQTLINSLLTMPALEHFSIGNNLMRDNNFIGKELARLLDGKTGLKSLDSISNGIGFEGIKALALSLKNNESLVKLNLWNNEVCASAMAVFLEGLMSNTTLTFVSIGPSVSMPEDSIPSKSYELMRDLLKRNEFMKKYPDNKDLIKAVCSKNGFYFPRKSDSYQPLSLRLLCARDALFGPHRERILHRASELPKDVMDFLILIRRWHGEIADLMNIKSYDVCVPHFRLK